jgi:hypothetical protein
MGHIYNPSTWDMEAAGSWFEASLGKRVCATLISGRKLVWWHASVIPATAESLK